VDQLFLLANRVVIVGLDVGDHHSLEKRSEGLPKGILAGFVLYFV